MIKRYLCLNLELAALRMCDAASLLEKRLVFADSNPPSGGSGGSGAEGEKEKLILANLEERLQEMEEAGKLSAKAVTAAINALRAGDEKAKDKILKMAVKVEDGSYTEADFSARIPKTAEKKEEKPTESGKEKAAEEKSEVESTEADISAIAGKVKLSSDEMLENAKAMEEAYAKREDIPEEMKQRIGALKKELEELNNLDRKNNDGFDDKIKKETDELVKNGKLTKGQAERILERDGLDPDFEEGTSRNKKQGHEGRKGFKELTRNCTDEKKQRGGGKNFKAEARSGGEEQDH